MLHPTAALSVIVITLIVLETLKYPLQGVLGVKEADPLPFVCHGGFDDPPSSLFALLVLVLFDCLSEVVQFIIEQLVQLVGVRDLKRVCLGDASAQEGGRVLGEVMADGDAEVRFANEGLLAQRISPGPAYI